MSCLKEHDVKQREKTCNNTSHSSCVISAPYATKRRKKISGKPRCNKLLAISYDRRNSYGLSPLEIRLCS